MLARLRAMDPYRVDLLLAAALLVEGLLEVTLLLPDETPRHGLIAVLVAGLAGCVAIRRRAPIVAALVGILRSWPFRRRATSTPRTSSARSSSRSCSSTASAGTSKGAPSGRSPPAPRC